MGLLKGLLTLPLAPVRGTVAVAEQVQQAAESEYYDPERIRAQLEDVEQRHAAGELTDDEATAWEEELIERLMIGSRRPKEG